MQTSAEIDNPTPQEEADWLAMQQHFNFGLNAVSKLRGNIGYLDYTGFMDAEPSAPAIGNAMDFLQHTGGLIIDLRKNSGGMPDAVALLASYFVGPERVHFNSIFWRDTDTTEEFWTRTDLEGTWYGKDRPVIILTSSETFSAAEDFTYGMKANKRAIVVGETTRGGANPGGIKRVSSNFSIWISSGKAINPITGSNWEGTGITPDHLTSAENARIEAEKRLLELVIARTDDPQAKHDRQQALEALEAEL
jgi:C-terminal processing protease CtpA/Prc